ncbi:hypothetical protein KI387_034415 [Taxus chinensis]|uniref:Receptor-like serine/threonine-protein kinase n=1 Tax=Taxus chinensis TaxID=29808 RepID=A0AA38C5I4_TAXCH|nr:hypothetical protein KI387_034415 [Taxus chinensis]
MMTVNCFMPCTTSVSLFVTFLVISSFLFEYCGALATANAVGGTTWINNERSLGSLPPPPDYIGPLTVRPILLTNNISYNGAILQYGCGFFCYSVPCDTGYLFATFFGIYRDDGTNPRDLQMVWSVNRERLVEENATLGLTSNGNLVLKDADGTLIWSTNTYSKDFQGMRIEESGNLVLLNNSNGHVGILVFAQTVSAAVQKRPMLLIRLMSPNPIWAVFHTVLSFAPKTPTTNNQDHQFLELEHISYFTYFYENASTSELVSSDECKSLCLKNCSCKAAFFRYDGVAKVSSGRCYLASIVYSLRTNNPSEVFYNSTAYIKIQATSKQGKSSVMAISVAVVGGVAVMFLLWWAWRFKSGRARQEEKMDEDDSVHWPVGLPLRYSFEELQKATNDFSLKLGSGGFGSVYEGVVSDGTKIAVKCLDRAGQGTKEFRAEVETLGNIHHLHLVRLKGFCAEKSHRMLVYEHLSNGSLDKWIFPNETRQHVLDWKTRSKVVLHIAQGLTYLHEECQERIIHFDIKPQNILLDQYFNAKVSDFGLAKLINREQSEVITMMRGTPGYMAPELLNMHVTEKADIFSFGVMVVEIVSGKRNRELSGHGLLSVLQSKAEEGTLIELVDSGLEDEGMDVQEEAVKMLEVGMWCIQDDFTRRPAMSIVVKALEGMIEINNFHFISSSASEQTLLSLPESNTLALSYTALSSVLSAR